MSFTVTNLLKAVTLISYNKTCLNKQGHPGATGSRGFKGEPGRNGKDGMAGIPGENGRPANKGEKGKSYYSWG